MIADQEDGHLQPAASVSLGGERGARLGRSRAHRNPALAREALDARALRPERGEAGLLGVRRAGYGRIWQDMAGYGGIWSDIWSDMVRYGEIHQDTAKKSSALGLKDLGRALSVLAGKNLLGQALMLVREQLLRGAP